MRKPIVGALSTAFLLGMAVSAQAVSVVAPPETTPVVTMGSVQVTLDGNVRMRGFMQQDTIQDNKNDAGNAWEDNEATHNAANTGSGSVPYGDYRPASLDTTGYDGRVQLGAKVQAGDGVTGYIRLETGDTTSDVYAWGDSNGLTADGGSKKADGNGNDLSILEGWLQYQPCNVGVKVGHMLLSHGNKLFFDHSASGDDAIIAFGEMVWGANVSGGVIKFEEGTALDNNNDVDGYFGTYTQKFGDAAMLGANLTFLNGKTDESNNLDVSLLEGMKLYNLGVDGAFKLGIVDLSADVEYQFGTVAEDFDGEEVDAKGYAAQVKATANLSKTFKLGGLVAYGSGEDSDNDDSYDGYVNFLTDTIYQVVIPGYRIAVPGQSTTNTGLTNMAIYQLFAKVDATCPITGKPLALEARVSKMLLNEDEDLNNEDDLGVELAGFATLKITKNLAYKLELAYLIAGDAWDAGSVDPDPDNAYFMRHTMELTF